MRSNRLENAVEQYSQYPVAEPAGHHRFQCGARTLSWAAALLCFGLAAGAHAQQADPRKQNPDSTVSAPSHGDAKPVPLRPNASDPPSASSANQFIFFAPDGTTLSSSPVVTWDNTNQQVALTPDTTSGAQDFLSINPLTFQANCGQFAEPTEIESDVDGTLYFLGHCGGTSSPGIERFFFRLDNSGAIALVGSNFGTMAGGIGTDLNGNTCLPYVNKDGSFAANQGCGNVATVFAPDSGLATQYAGLASSGQSNGFPFIVKAIDTIETGSVPDYFLYTTLASGIGGPGMYRLEAYMVATTSVAQATMQFTVAYNDGQAIQTLSSGPPVWFNAKGTLLNFSQPFYVTANSPIVVSTVATSFPTYHVVIRLIAE
ncbi:MAG: hypothetical protein WB780_02515 [Candidatus Acidiferrales bacterium]